MKMILRENKGLWVFCTNHYIQQPQWC